MRNQILAFAVFAAVAGVAGSSGTARAIPSASYQSDLAPQEHIAQALPNATVTRTLKPAVKPTPAAAVYPLKQGDSFTYQYASSTKAGFSPWVNEQGVETATVSGLGTYNGIPAYQLRTTGHTTSGPTESLDDIDYVNLIGSGGHMEYVVYGYNYLTKIDRTSGVTEFDRTIVDYATPFVNDVLPERAGVPWTEPVAISERINNFYDQTANPNILSGTLKRAADGSYTASVMKYASPETRLLRSDGTGYVVDGATPHANEWTYGLPRKDNSIEVIPVTYSHAGRETTSLIHDWYPGGGAPPKPLATESTQDLGPQRIPSGCGKYSGMTAIRLETIFSQLDPIVGFTIQDYTSRWVVAGVGVVCAAENDLEQDYDTLTGFRGPLTTTDSIKWLVSEVLS